MVRDALLIILAVSVAVLGFRLWSMRRGGTAAMRSPWIGGR